MHQTLSAVSGSMKAPKNMPVHEFIKQQLRRKIERGDLSEGDQLPSENELARQFEVSRSLARLALRELEIEGYITRSQGARSRVAPSPQTRTEVSFPKARILALAFIGVQSRFTREIVDRFSRQAFEEGYHVLTYNLWLDNEEQLQFLRSLRQSGVAGLALGLWQDCHSDALRELMREFVESSFPVVQIDRHIPDLDGGDYVGSDNRAIGEWLTSSLISRGHRRICFLADLLETTSVRERFEGYRAALKRHGLTFDPELLIQPDRASQRTAASAVRRILHQPDAPTAFLCVNEYLLSQLHETLGLSAQDLCTRFGIAVVDDSQLCERLDLPVVKAVQPAEQIGVESAQCLIARIAEPSRPPQVRHLRPGFFDLRKGPGDPEA